MILVICDSAFKNASDKHSQGAYLIALGEQKADGSIGGNIHVIEIVSKKSKRVAKSTWSAELLALATGLERPERAQDWWREIVNGPTTARGLRRLEETKHELIKSVAVTDCRGLWDLVASPVIGSVVDTGMLVYLVAVRETMESGVLTEIARVPTNSMLVDACTKPMIDVCWKSYYRTGEWVPAEAVICERQDSGKKSIRTVKSPTLITLLPEIDYWGVEEKESEEDEILNYLAGKIHGSGQAGLVYFCLWSL